MDLAHSTPLRPGIDLSGLDLFGGGPVPATVVQHGGDRPRAADDSPRSVSADHTLDLTGAGLPPESFTVHASADPTGAWGGGRSAAWPTARWPAGDPDGVAGQAARLAAVLPGLIAAAGGPVLVLCTGAAGDPAVRACAGLAGVAAVVTIGTPWSAVAVDTLDRVPGAEGAAAAGHAASGPRPGGLR